MKKNTLNAYNIADLRELARRRLPKGIFEAIDRGSEDEVALRNNRQAFERIKLKPRRLVNVSNRSQAITLFGQKQKMPIVVAPTGTTGQMWYQGEIALALAAAAAGIPFTLSNAATFAMEQVVERGGGNPWFQLYMVPDRSMSYRVVERARVAGFEALVVTVDSMISTNREFSIRNGFTMPFTFNFTNMIDVLMHPRWLLGVMVRYLLTTGMPRYENYPSELISSITSRKAGQLMTKNETLEWDDLRALRKLWPRTLIVKGILDPQDAILAADCGADAVIVSNHGGIVFDSAMAPIEVLPAVVDARQPHPCAGGQRFPARERCGQGACARSKGGNDRARDIVRDGRRRRGWRRKSDRPPAPGDRPQPGATWLSGHQCA
jgi:isopentenyl diphosphate isomerase/L-lactate dehydrogenase-like FMN-dependent dehydrogenase